MADGRNIGRFINDLRMERNLTEKEVADAVGVSQMDVINWEKGKTSPDVSLLPDIAELFDVSIAELLDGSRHGVDYPEASESEKFDSIMKYAKGNMNHFTKEIPKQLLILISIVMLVIVVATMLIEWLTVRQLNWSLIVTVSIVLVWGTIIPLFLPVKQPLQKSLLVFCILTIPYFILLDWILGLNGGLRNIAIPSSIAVYVYAWVLYYVFTRFNFNRLQLAGIVLIGLMIVVLVIEISISAVTAVPFFTWGNMITLVLLGGLGAGALYWDYRESHGLNEPTDTTDPNDPLV